MTHILNLDQYEILTAIGSGSFSDVYKIRDKKTGKFYAAKITKQKLDDISSSEYKEFQREIEILSKTSHKLFIKYFGYSPVNFQNEKKPVIITELVNNGTLKSIINLKIEDQLKIGWNGTLKLINIYGIAYALYILHTKKIIHRDLKPANIFIDDFLCPKIADFGLSKQMHYNTDSMSWNSIQSIKGTPVFLAPEIWDDKLYTEAGDVYAFAMVVYQIVTNENPFNDIQDVFKINKKVTSGDRPKLDSNIPNSYRALIEMCWKQNHSDRPTFAQIVEKLRNDSGFITEDVNEEDFRLYIAFIDQFYNNESNCTTFIDEFSKYKSKTFTRKFLNPEKLDQTEIEDIFIKAKKFENGDKKSKIPIDLEEASRLYTITADIGHIDSMLSLGKILMNGNKADKERGATYLKKAADKNDVEAMYLYGLALSKGEDVPSNHKESCKYFQMASDKGHLDAMYNYGMNLLNGNGIDIDISEATRLLRKSARKGHPLAMYNYGILLKDDKKKSAKYLKKAADKGIKEAMAAYGKMLLTGDGIPINIEKANHYIEMGTSSQPISEWYKLKSLDDFTILNEYIKEPQIKKGVVISTSQPVAIKYSINCSLNDLKNECDILIRCSHPSIQKLIGLYESPDNNSSAMITQYCAQRSLDEYLRNTANDTNDDDDDDEDEDEEDNQDYNMQYKFIYHICQAMKHLEEKRMFHGYLNPSNILLDEEYNPILNNIKMRENYSKDEIEQSNMMINYLAPEILSGYKNSIKADVYSFGLIMEQIFTKAVPYSNQRSKQDIINMVLKEKYDISEKVPKFIRNISIKCLDKNPNNRPNFEDIFNELTKKLEHNSYIQKYQKMINSQIQLPVTFFRIPKAIVKLPENFNNTDQKKDTEQDKYKIPNFEDVRDKTLISFDNLDQIFSTVAYDRIIKIIMVCGKYQSGKSTLLRMITGNGAFYSGKSYSTTTMGIIIDGPYSIKEIIDRIGIKAFKNSFLHDSIILEKNPAIFFIDSQGIGDEYSQCHSNIMKHYFSFFCALSDVCINISEMTETFDIFSQILNTIRGGLLMKIKIDEKIDDVEFNKQITKILFLTKSFNELNKEIKTKKGFKSIQQNFELFWCQQHQNAYESYFPDLFKAFPLGDIINHPLTYNCSIWNIIPEIFNFMNNSIDYTKSCIKSKIENAIIFIFSDFFETFKQIDNEIDKQINFIASFSSELVNHLILQYKKKECNKKNTIDSFSYFLKMIIEFIIPFTIVQNTNIPFQDCNQYGYDLMKDIISYLRKNVKTLKKNLYNSILELYAKDVHKISKSNEMNCYSIESSDSSDSSDSSSSSSSSAILIRETPNIRYYSYLSIFIYAICNIGRNLRKKNIIKQMEKDKIEISIPFLWNKINNKQKSIIMPIIKKPENILSRYNNSEIIIVLENQTSTFMKFIIQSMTGAKCDFNINNENKETILYGPFLPENLTSRISRCYPKYSSKIIKEIYFLYLRDYTNEELNQIQIIQEKSLFCMSSNESIGSYPPNREKLFHMFYFVQRPEIKLLRKKDCVEIQNQLNKEVPNNDYNIKFWPILMKDHTCFDGIGPQLNKNLRWAFHQILKSND